MTLEIGIEHDEWDRPKPKMQHGARFDVSLDRLAEMLGLPEGAKVVGIWGGVSQQTFKRTVTVMVEHPDLPEMVEGDLVPAINPVFEWCDVEQKEILTDWGI